MEAPEPIAALIPKITEHGKLDGVTNWSIAFTNNAIYFINHGVSGGPGLGFGQTMYLAADGAKERIIKDLIKKRKSRKVTIGDNINDLLFIAINYFKFDRQTVNKIILKRFLFFGVARFPNGKEKTWYQSDKISLWLRPKRYRLFKKMINNMM